jgi:uncharacterized membrane protein YfcA
VIPLQLIGKRRHRLWWNRAAHRSGLGHAQTNLVLHAPLCLIFPLPPGPHRKSRLFGFLPVIIDPLFYILAAPAIVFLGIGKGGFAGVGMVSTPLLALYLPPLQAAAILLPIILCQDVISIWTYRRDWDAWNVKVLSVGAVIGIGVAWALAAVVSDGVVRLIVGLIGIWFVLNAWFGKIPDAVKQPNISSGISWGAAAAFTSTLIQAGAPPYQTFMLPQHLPKLTLVGTTTVFFAGVNVMKVAPYFALGQFSTETLGTSAVLLPFAIATNFLGIWLVRVTPTERFYRIAYALVFFISLALIFQGGAAMLPA